MRGGSDIILNSFIDENEDVIDEVGEDGLLMN